MLMDFVQFCANLAIALIGLRLLQAKTAGTEWGKALAFLG